MSPTTLWDLASKFDETPAEDSRTRLAIGDEMELLLGKDCAEFLELYDRYKDEKRPTPVTRVLEQMGFQKGEPPPPAPAPAPAPPPLSEEQRIQKAAAAYRLWRTLARQAQVSEEELRDASATWQAERDSIEQGTPTAAQLQAATEQIDADLAEERRRPPLHPHQLPGALPVP